MKKEDYYNQAQDWHIDTEAVTGLERNRYFVLTLVFAVIAALAVLAVIILTPLKTVEPYMVENNTATGEIRAINKMSSDTFVPSKQNTIKHIADYIRYRESFDHNTIREHYRYVQLMSDDKVTNEYKDFMQNDLQSPYKKLKEGEHIEIYITDMNPINDQSYIVHADTTEYLKDQSRPSRKRWAIVVDFKWLGVPTDNEYRYFNPAGFTATRYRKDQILIGGIN